MGNYRCGLIGCGFIGTEAPDNHFKAYQSNSKTTVITLCDTDGQRVIQTFNKYSTLPPGTWPTDSLWIEYIPMVQKMNLDIVSVCTPVETHKEIVCGIAPFVRAIWCEKPIAATLEDADKMMDTCIDNNVLLVVNHQREFTAPVFRLRGTQGYLSAYTHLFSTLLNIFDRVEVGKGEVFIDGHRLTIEEPDEPCFEFDVCHNKERMLPKVLDHIVHTLDSYSKFDYRWFSNAYGAREALRLCLEYR